MTEACKRLAAGAQWPTANPGRSFTATSSAFQVAISVHAKGDASEAPATLYEEVGAILEGSFSVLAAGESYTLSTGEAIIIPPGEPRRYICRERRGVLYRVQVTAPRSSTP